MRHSKKAAPKVLNQHPTLIVKQPEKVTRNDSHVSSLSAEEIVSNPRFKDLFVGHLNESRTIDRKRLIDVSLKQIDVERENEMLYRQYLSSVEEKLRPKVNKRFSKVKRRAQISPHSPVPVTAMTKYSEFGMGAPMRETSFAGLSRNKNAMNMTMMPHQTSNLDSTLFREKLLLNNQMRTLSRLSQDSDKRPFDLTTS